MLLLHRRPSPAAGRHHPDTLRRFLKLVAPRRLPRCSFSPGVLGEAVTSSLIDSPIFASARGADGAHCTATPLIIPSKHATPFSATLYMVGNSSQALKEAAARRSNGHNSTTATATALPSNRASHHTHCHDDILDVDYVLSGSGVMTTADSDAPHPLRAGDSLVTWHGTTRLSCSHPPSHAGSSQVSHSLPGLIDASESLAVLTFHIPLSALDPLGSFSEFAAAGRQLLAALEAAATPPGAAPLGSLTHDAARDILSAAKNRVKLVPVGEAIASSHGSAAERSGSAAGSFEVAAQQQQQQQQPVAQHAVTAPVSGTELAATATLWSHLRARQQTLIDLDVVVGRAQRAWAQHGFVKWLHTRVGNTSAPQQTTASPRSHLSSGAMDGFLGAEAFAGKPTAAAAVVGTAEDVAAPAAAASVSSTATATALPSPRALPLEGGVLLRRSLEQFRAYRFPNQTNRIAFVFDPSEVALPLSFAVEVFEPGHVTPLHTHEAAHELFFVLSGTGVARCGTSSTEVHPGDVVVFPPLALHGLDNAGGTRLFCLQLMTPNEAFVEYVKTGEAVGRLADEDICQLVAQYC